MTRKTSTPPRSRDFLPVPVRPRQDGWTPERQVAFIETLAATANVEAAAKAAGMGRASAYALRARPDASAFREAWSIALDYAVHQLAEAALDRAINGVATPVFFQGEQIGERRYYDEKLAMFLLRLRDPQRFGRWREDRVPLAHPDAPAIRLQAALNEVENAAHATEAGEPPARSRPVPTGILLTARHAQALDDALIDRVVEQQENDSGVETEESEALTAELLRRIAALKRRQAQQAATAAEPDTEGGM